ncbi:hypothetical protein M9H77_37193 [Catharanthus roseus]|uniref:Uncharacterized protein n=1 Tax=Catharanthus roseus TaxID=4058 RepID=A0ACB9ZVX4_CATRO|nr:hypothetical protein M9H77_37193 [Catharanthus roseus]
MSSMISTLLSGSDPLISMANMCPVLSTPIDWKETPESHVFIADLPGLSKDEVKVEINDGRILQISGERKAEAAAAAADGGEKWHRVERNRGDFCRRFRLPENAKTDEIKASMENGVLTVTIPKLELKKPMKKVIEIEEK